MRRRPKPPLPGLTRQSILLRKKMDARVKPAHDGVLTSAAPLGRREFIALLAGAIAAVWPLAARAQQERMRRIGVLNDYGEADPAGEAQLAAFREELEKLGWTEGRNVRIDHRAGAADADALRTYAAEMVALAPDVIFAAGATIVAALQRASRSVPIVFVNVTDPVGGGLVASLARPGGNATGFSQFEFGISAKWLELLKDIAPGVTRVAVIRDPTARTGGAQLGAIQAVAPSLGVEVSPVDPQDADAIERGLAAFARDRASGLIVTTSRLARAHRDLIIALAARHRLPAVYPFRVYVAAGGLISYGPDSTDEYRRAAGYVDRILKGEKPADLPVQAPTRYQLVVNLKTAKALGLEIPTPVLARADEVIE
jgi:putative ABC transport system substrate-binding protein